MALHGQRNYAQSVKLFVSCAILMFPHVFTEPLSSCNKTDFMRNYLRKGKPVALDDLNRTCFAEYSSKCKGDLEDPRFSVAEDKLNGRYYILAAANASHKKTENAGCWGLVLQYTSDQQTFANYDNFDKNGMLHWTVKYMLKTNYSVTIAMVPTGRHFLFHLTSPGRCDLEVLHDIDRKLQKIKTSPVCQENLTWFTRINFASKICKEYENDTDGRREHLRRNLQVTDCKLKFAAAQTVATAEDTMSLSNSIILSMSCVLAVLVFLFVLMVSRNRLKELCRRIKYFKYEEKALMMKDQQHWEGEEFDHTPSVMILNRPGCELMETFLRDFAFVLQSYGIDVKLALLEQNQLDQEGGIASYMQRNIDTCDYVLIMFTEPQPEGNINVKHKPYEFALKVIGGLAYHQNDSSRYIPLYLTTYKEVVGILPSFLNASMTFGYQIPHNLDGLIQKLLRVDTNLLLSKDRRAKDQFFISKMIEQSERILQDQHPHCLQGNCSKGLSSISVVNLSSIWPTTVNSKCWDSTRSLDTNYNDAQDRVYHSRSYEILVENKLQSMFNRQALYESKMNSELECAGDTNDSNEVSVDTDYTTLTNNLQEFQSNTANSSNEDIMCTTSVNS